MDRFQMMERHINHLYGLLGCVSVLQPLWTTCSGFPDPLPIAKCDSHPKSHFLGLIPELILRGSASLMLWMHQIPSSLKINFPLLHLKGNAILYNLMDHHLNKMTGLPVNMSLP